MDEDGDKHQRHALNQPRSVAWLSVATQDAQGGFDSLLELRADRHRGGRPAGCLASFRRGVAERLEIQVSYAIGVARPLSLMVETFGTHKIAPEKIQQLLTDHFDFRPGAIIQNLDLRRPIYQATAAYGHFGRNDIDAPWEKTDKAELLRKEAGL